MHTVRVLTEIGAPHCAPVKTQTTCRSSHSLRLNVPLAFDTFLAPRQQGKSGMSESVRGITKQLEGVGDFSTETQHL